MSKTSVVIVSVLGLVGCKHPGPKDVPDKCIPIPEEHCTETADETGGGGTGGDETADGEYGDPKELGPDACVFNVSTDKVGYRMQCEGDLFTTLKFDLPFGYNCEKALGTDVCSQHHVFGPPNDTYAAPDVMACCGEPWDPQYDDVYLKNCSYDLIQQVCVTLAKRLEGYILDGKFGNHAGQAAELQVWIANHNVDCNEALRQNDSNPDPGALESFWTIPNSPKWHLIQNMEFHVDAGTESTSVIRPKSPKDWISCNGADGNNDEIFEDKHTANGGVVAGVDLIDPVLGELVGPKIFGNEVSASAMFEASCIPQGCPTAMFSYDDDGGTFTLEDLNLYAQSFVITNGASGLTVERARIELWGQAVGTAVHVPEGGLLGASIPIGAARFLLAGSSGSNHNRFTGTNATDIEISIVDDKWNVQSFIIEYEDGEGGVWVLTLAESEWK